MKWFQEITEWATEIQPNHVYLMNDSRTKAFAYKPWGRGAVQKFRSPLTIDLRGRKFKLNDRQFATDIQEEKPQGRVYTVVGSRGDQYQVSENNGSWSCSCSGFRFRGRCRHVDSIKNQN